MARMVVYKVASELMAAKVPVVHGPWIKVRRNVEQSGRNPQSPRILIENGVLTSFSTMDQPVIAIQNMRLQATSAPFKSLRRFKNGGELSRFRNWSAVIPKAARLFRIATEPNV
jgi:hypothetical protein